MNRRIGITLVSVILVAAFTYILYVYGIAFNNNNILSFSDDDIPDRFPCKEIIIDSAKKNSGRFIDGDVFPSIGEFVVYFRTKLSYQKVKYSLKQQLEDYDITEFHEYDLSSDDNGFIHVINYSDDTNWLVTLTYYDQRGMKDEKLKEHFKGSSLIGYKLEIVDLKSIGDDPMNHYSQ